MGEGCGTVSPRNVSTLHRAGNFLKSSFENFFGSRPELDESMPLTVFFHTTHSLKKAVRQLEAAKSELDQFVAIERLHKCQTDVLVALERVFADVNDPRQSREYRLKFPAEVQHELQSYFWETLLFAAELIADGRILEGRERATELLRPAAVELCEAFETVNRVLRAQARKDPTSYSPKVRSCLRYFDTAWATFENLYVRAVVPCVSTDEYTTKQEITVMFSEGVMRGLKSKAITQEMIDDYEPQVMFAIPRLAIMTGMLLNAESMLGFTWLKAHDIQLREIQEKLSGMCESDLRQLEHMLTDGASASDDVGGETYAASAQVHELFRLISNVSDRLQQGDHRKEFREVMSSLFKMYQDHPLLDSHLVADQSDEGTSPNTITLNPALAAASHRRPSATSVHHEEFRELSNRLIEQGGGARHEVERSLGTTLGDLAETMEERRRASVNSVTQMVPLRRESIGGVERLGITVTNLGVESIDDFSSQSMAALNAALQSESSFMSSSDQSQVPNFHSSGNLHGLLLEENEFAEIADANEPWPQVCSPIANECRETETIEISEISEKARGKLPIEGMGVGEASNSIKVNGADSNNGSSPQRVDMTRDSQLRSTPSVEITPSSPENTRSQPKRRTSVIRRMMTRMNAAKAMGQASRGWFSRRGEPSTSGSSTPSHTCAMGQ
eukprot:comp7524_c0_seq1/m.3189 comp7524_c0_seq1/g.3189  ORF comp7524_c0_seq1/g.3189 comp7524_c0_seq1/m.3189 type:complete len:674 (-) comp7524_c0_seq1:763-2784(-)